MSAELPREDAKVISLRPAGPPAEDERASDVSYEIELDEPEPAPVLAPSAAAPGTEMRPVIPKHLRTAEGLRIAARHQAALAWYRARFHGVRSPRYLIAALLWAVIGLFRILGRQIRWWWFTEQNALRNAAAAAGDSREHTKLHKEAKETRAFRAGVLGIEAAVILSACTALAVYGRWWADALAICAALPLLAHHGRPADKPIIAPAVVTPRFRRLSADVVLRAYYAAGLGHPDKPGQQVTFGAPMARDGEGSRVVVDLPYGKGLGDAVNARSAIASGLDVTESQVFLHRDPTSHRRHALWVADRDPLAVPVGRTPLLSGKATDIWRPAPMGLDERGQLVTVPLMWNSVLVGALPRQGKTFSARLLGLYCALDPYVKLSVFDAKGSPDWRKFAMVADASAFGLTPTRDGLPPEILLDVLNEVKDDVQHRYQRLSELPTDVCPDGKLTRRIARDPRYGMPVRVLILEEVQEYYDLGDISKEIAPLITFLVKVAPGAGVTVIASTQKPSGIGGSGAVGQQFISARDQFQIRFALRTSSWQVSEMVLGQGAYSEGLDSSALLPQYKGVGILRGAYDASPTVRTYLADGQDAEKILIAARGLREKAGTLSGMARGESPVKDTRDVLADVLMVFSPGEPGLHWEVLADRLAARFPDRWADATAEAVSAQCRGLGVPSVNVKMAGRNLNGCRKFDVEEAVTRR
jgi:DNA segregation ATPase FtsK/SpoIIIE, S-DNA-T family